MDRLGWIVAQVLFYGVGGGVCGYVAGMILQTVRGKPPLVEPWVLATSGVLGGLIWGLNRSRKGLGPGDEDRAA